MAYVGAARQCTRRYRFGRSRHVTRARACVCSGAAVTVDVYVALRIFELDCRDNLTRIARRGAAEPGPRRRAGGVTGPRAPRRGADRVSFILVNIYVVL